MFTGFGSVCSPAEWADSEKNNCEARNLDDYYLNIPPASLPVIVTAPILSMSATQLANAIAAANGALNVWTSDVSKSAELKAASANSSKFSVKKGAEPGEYIITLKSATSAPVLAPTSDTIKEYLPYVLGGAGLLLVLTMIKK